MRNSCCILVFLCLFQPIALHAQEGYWQQDVHYKMDVTLLPLKHALIGDETIIYKNNSPDTLKRIYLHLYPNAYRSSRSVRATEAREFHQRLIPRKQDAGSIDIETFRILSGERPAQKTLTAFEVNDTILSAQLPEPLPPGGEVTIQLSFNLKVRKFSGRAGYRGFQYDFAQWYPKMCVYDETGWNNQPFHYLGEFYGEFGTFDVTVNVPSGYVVGATGVVVDGDPGWNMVKVDTSLSRTEWQAAFERIKQNVRRLAAGGKLRKVTFHAENVHDFAWVTSPDFLYEKGMWRDVPVHVLYRSYAKERWSKRVVRRGKRALSWLSQKFGLYPYPQLTITHGLLGGGMEYPMLVMNSSEREGLILHEVGHIYFYGILANNEWKEAWLDEGFTSFQTRWYMETRYGKWGYDRQTALQGATWLQKHRPGITRRFQDRQTALAYINSGKNEPISKAAYAFREPLAYRRNAYTKGAFFYDLLKYVVGDSVFNQICHEYFDRWKFKHVNEMRFKQVCEDVSGETLDWFFAQWLHTDAKIDYALGAVRKARIDSLWETEVQILRKANGTMPVEVALTTASGKTLTKRWDGFDKIGRLTFETAEKPRRIVLDPDDAILDNNLFNNGGTQIEFHYDYPNSAYRPRRAYLLTWRPMAWYNSVDKARVGLRLNAHEGFAKNLDLGLWFGTDSQVLDGRARFSSRIEALGARTRGAVLIQKLEGRFEVDAHLTFTKSKYLAVPPFHRFWLGFNHSQLLGTHAGDYVLREYDQKQDVQLPVWQDGIVNKLYGRYSLNPSGRKWFTNLAFGFDSVQEDWGSDFTYNTVFSELRFWTPSNSQGLFLRLYGKKIFHSQDAPVQDLIFLDGANPRTRFSRVYLRSQGALPEELHYQLPGGGNARGFYNQPIFGDQILALNTEVRKTLSTQNAKGAGAVFGTTGVALFADIAGMEFRDSRSEFYADAGIGLRLQKTLPDNWITLFTRTRNITLRLDFPIWVNKPLPDERKFRFRWVFGFEQAI